MPKVGKKRFDYTKTGRKAAKAYAKKKNKKLSEQVIGPVASRLIQRRRERSKATGARVDPMSTRIASTPKKSVTATAGSRHRIGVSLKQARHRGHGLEKRDTGITARRKQASLGIAASTEMDWKNKLVEVSTPKTPKQKDDARLAKDAGDLKTIHSKKKFELMDLVPPSIRFKDSMSGGTIGAKERLVGGKTRRERLHGRKVSAAKKRLAARDTARTSAERTRPEKQSLKTRVAIRGVKHKRDVAIAQKGADREVRLAASTEMDWTNKLVEMITEKKGKA